MLVAVSVYGAEEAAAPAGEPGQPHLLLAHAAPVLLLLPVAGALLPGGPGGGAGPGADLGALLGLGLCLRPHTGHYCGLGGLQRCGRGRGRLLLVAQTLEARAGGGACKENIVSTMNAINSIPNYVKSQCKKSME